MPSRPGWGPLALLALLAACGPGAEKPSLVALQGRWVTDDPEYADRFFEITPDECIRLGTSGAENAAHPIEHVAVEETSEGGLAYELTYVDPEGVELGLLLRVHVGRRRHPAGQSGTHEMDPHRAMTPC